MYTNFNACFVGLFVYLYFILQMAAIARGHGGDCGGDPPGGDRWQPPSGSCGGSRGIKKIRNVFLIYLISIIFNTFT